MTLPDESRDVIGKKSRNLELVGETKNEFVRPGLTF